MVVVWWLVVHAGLNSVNAAYLVLLILSFLSLASRVLFLAPFVTFLFVCALYIAGMAERICANFTGKSAWTNLNVKVKGQRSRSPGTKKEKLLSYPRQSFCHK